MHPVRNDDAKLSHFFPKKLSVKILSYLHTQATVLRVQSQWAFKHYFARHECSIVWYHSLALPPFTLAHSIESLRLFGMLWMKATCELQVSNSRKLAVPPPHLWIYSVKLCIHVFMYINRSAVIQIEISRTIL